MFFQARSDEEIIVSRIDDSDCGQAEFRKGFLVVVQSKFELFQRVRQFYQWTRFPRVSALWWRENFLLPDLKNERQPRQRRLTTVAKSSATMISKTLVY